MNEKDEPDRKLLIGVVGPCGSGKTTLIAGLEREGFRCRHIAQEHSYVPYMWQRITNPDLLIYLNSSFEVSTQRRKLSWNEAEYQEQLRRLDHARQHADLIIETDDLSPPKVLECTINFIKSKNQNLIG
jgi:deoxyadenosine/deoxycytidine kinase